ncbi:MAG: ABC transporter substrate-binding protein, partial [Beijerinckiaceae bacterium]
SFIGVGGGASAVAAMKKGEIDVISHLDPVISKLESDGDITTLIDTRTEAGTKALFGGTNPAAVVYTRGDFIEKNPESAQRLTNAFVKALKWLATAKPEDVANTVPEAYHLGDKALYVAAVKASMESYSRTGLIPAEGMASILDMLKKLDAEMATANVDLSKTFVDRFVKKANGQA